MTLVGSAERNEKVTMYVLSEEKQFEVTADTAGNWTFDVWTSDLSEIEHQIDLDGASTNRYKALSFTVLPLGQQTKVVEAPPSVPGTSPTSSRPFPWVPVGAAVVILVGSGAGTYWFIRKRNRRVLDQTPGA